jgi:CTP:molybdopterin cytidylyltransferase MocA
MTTESDWLKDKISYIKGLKSPSEQQRLLVLLADMPVRDANDQKKLAAIIRAEKAAERAAKARTAATALIQAEKRAAAAAERKARTHELCQSAGLLGLVGLVDTKTGKPTINRAELLGALMGLASVPADDPRRQQWRQAGAGLLAKVENRQA